MLTFGLAFGFTIEIGFKQIACGITLGSFLKPMDVLMNFCTKSKLRSSSTRFGYVVVSIRGHKC